MDDLTLGQMIFGGGNVSNTPSRPVNNTTTISGVALSNSVNGYVEIMIDNQPTKVATTYAIAEGDTCIVSITNKVPTVIGVVGKGDKVDQTIDGTIRATSAVIMSIVAGSVDAESIEAGEAYIKTLTAEDFYAENVSATTAKFMELYSKNGKFDNLVATKATIDTLNATKAFIDDLTSKNVTTDKIVAGTAIVEALNTNKISAEDVASNHIYVNSLEGVYANVDELVADLAKIKELNVEDLTAKLAEIDTLDTKYAKIDMTNVNEASITTALIQDAAITEAKIMDGAIHAAQIADATITAAKIHDINADLITAGTLKTERLLLVDNETGETSIVKAINVANGVATSVASGTKIQAESIDVVDLWALNATIGGFTIDRSSLYNAKKAIGDPNSGVYIGLDGVGIGDGNILGLTDKSPFMMKSDGTFWLGGSTDNLSFDPSTGKLSINVGELSVASNDILQSLEDLEGRVTANTSQITQNANSVSIEFQRVDSSLQKNEEDLNTFKSYIRFGSTDKYGSYIDLGADDSKFKTLISNKKGLLFTESDQEVAYINNKAMHITRAEVTDILAINNWKWEQRSNGNLSFKWREI